MGTSGLGKSTILHMLGGLDRPTSGKVFVDGKDIFGLKDEALPIQLDGAKPDTAYVEQIIFRPVVIGFGECAKQSIGI